LQNKVKFGIIGCSRIADSSTIPAIKNSQFAELKIIGSRSEQKAEKFAKKFDCELFGSYDDVIENDKVDSVYISLPVGLHEEWALKASEAGKHVLCEKSSTISYDSACKMVESCKQNNVRIMEAFMFRFHPQHNEVLELTRKGFVGDLFTFTSSYGFPSIPRSDIRFNKELGGGVLNDAGCYPICASRIVFGKEPEGVFCNLIVDEEMKVDTKATLFLKYKGMKFAQIAVGYGLFYQSTYSIWGTNGSLRLTRSYNIPSDMKATIILNSDKSKQEIIIAPTNHYVHMIDSFCKEIITDSFHGFDFEDDLLQQAKVMQAARLSNNEHRFVKIDEI